MVLEERLEEVEKQKKKKIKIQYQKIIITDPKKIFELPLNTIFNFLIDKHIVKDKYQALQLINNQLGGTKNLDVKNMMSYGEFNKLFCKSMFKQALVRTLDDLLKVKSTDADVKKEDDSDEIGSQ